jgi:hypothetical protein
MSAELRIQSNNTLSTCIQKNDIESLRKLFLEIDNLNRAITHLANQTNNNEIFEIFGVSIATPINIFLTFKNKFIVDLDISQLQPYVINAIKAYSYDCAEFLLDRFLEINHENLSSADYVELIFILLISIEKKIDQSNNTIKERQLILFKKLFNVKVLEEGYVLEIFSLTVIFHNYDFITHILKMLPDININRYIYSKIDNIADRLITLGFPSNYLKNLHKNVWHTIVSVDDLQILKILIEENKLDVSSHDLLAHCLKQKEISSSFVETLLQIGFGISYVFNKSEAQYVIDNCLSKKVLLLGAKIRIAKDTLDNTASDNSAVEEVALTNLGNKKNRIVTLQQLKEVKLNTLEDVLLLKRWRTSMVDILSKNLDNYKSVTFTLLQALDIITYAISKRNSFATLQEHCFFEVRENIDNPKLHESIKKHNPANKLIYELVNTDIQQNKTKEKIINFIIKLYYKHNPYFATIEKLIVEICCASPHFSEIINKGYQELLDKLVCLLLAQRKYVQNNGNIEEVIYQKKEIYEALDPSRRIKELQAAWSVEISSTKVDPEEKIDETPDWRSNQPLVAWDITSVFAFSKLPETEACNLEGFENCLISNFLDKLASKIPKTTDAYKKIMEYRKEHTSYMSNFEQTKSDEYFIKL